jgi:hypothetical protein
MNINFTAKQVRNARELLQLNQPDFATALGWTTKRNVVSLESETDPKQCMPQTALAIECLLRRADLWVEFNLIK